MRFIVVHKVASYLMVVASLLTLVTSGELAPAVTGLAFLAVAVSWGWEPGRVRFERFETLWNALTLLMLGKTLFEVFTGGAILISGVHFIVFLTVNKLFNRRASRDYLQLYVVSFLMVVAATALNTDLVFGGLFLLYIVFTTWTLILFHLKREMEENYLLKYGDSLEGRPVQVQRVLNSRKLVGGRFLLATSAISLVVFLGAATVFFLFPRVGFGFFFKKSRAGISMAGFSDELELGHFGVIKDNPTVVMRVEFGDPADRNRLPPYWRGITFDNYDGQRWSKTSQSRRVMRPHDGVYWVRAPARAPPARVRQSIYLEPMETQVLFGLDRLVGVELPRGRVRLPGRRPWLQSSAGRDVYYEQIDDVAFRYVALSEPHDAPPALAGRPLAEYRAELVRDWPRTPYLQLPEVLDPRVAALARTIIGDATTVDEAVERVQRHLQSEYAYTLDLGRDERYAPLEDFLFVQRRGHCEYFSTAMAVLLRTQGIATRNVNGFYGGAWNQYGGYTAVSQGDAHSWVEVLYGVEVTRGRRGERRLRPTWVRRDPTPSGAARVAGSSVWSKVLQYTDALRLRWYKWVIEYDLQKQLGFLVRLRDVWSDSRESAPGADAREKTDRMQGPAARRFALWLTAIALLLALGYILLMRATGGGRGRSERASAAVAGLYLELVEAYRRLGLRRSADTTAREFLERLQRRRAPGLAVAREVVDLYESVRFGGALPDDGEVAALQRRVASWKGAPTDE